MHDTTRGAWKNCKKAREEESWRKPASPFKGVLSCKQVDGKTDANLYISNTYQCTLVHSRNYIERVIHRSSSKATSRLSSTLETLDRDADLSAAPFAQCWRCSSLSYSCSSSHDRTLFADAATRRHDDDNDDDMRVRFLSPAFIFRSEEIAEWR